MTTMSNEEYLKLIESLDQEDEDYCDDIPEDAWFPSESAVKKKEVPARNIDALNLNKDKIKEILYETSSIDVGSFIVRVNAYHGFPVKIGEFEVPNSTLTLDHSLWERKHKTFSGHPCNMVYRLNILKDDRFVGRTWLDHFETFGGALDVPIDTVVDIIKWLQTIQKYPAFL